MVSKVSVDDTFLCCSACEECLLLRTRQKGNGVLKADDNETKKLKRRLFNSAEKELTAHLNDLSIPNHGLYNEEHRFPKGDLIWENGSYKDLEEEEKTHTEAVFLEKLHAATEDFRENHYVGTK
jgi:hypothetical protein